MHGEAAPAELAPAGRKVPLVNIANALTTLRLLLVPVFLGCLLIGASPGWRIGAFVVFCVAALTDQVDGQLARGLGLVTDFGKVADPLADKALVGAALLALSALGELPWWVTAVILVRELGVTGLRFAVSRHGMLPVSRGGKLKTTVQTAAIGLYVLDLHGALASLRGWLLAAAVLLTVATGVDYLVRAWALRRTGR